MVKYKFTMFSDLDTIKGLKMGKIIQWVYLKRLDIFYDKLYKMPAFKECSTLTIKRESKELCASYEGTKEECLKRKNILDKFLDSADLKSTLKEHTKGFRAKIMQKAINNAHLNAREYLDSIGVICVSEMYE